MVAKAQSIRVGLFAAATLFLLGVVVAVFGGLRVWDDVDRYHLVSSSSVIGLQPGAQVYLNGIKVGTVDDVGVLPEDLRKVSIAIKLKHGTPVRTDTQAFLQYAGITGLKVIDLRGGTTGAPPLPPGSEIALGAGMLDKLEAQAQTIVEQSTALLQRANRLTDNLIAMTDSLDGLTGLVEPARRAADNLATLTGSLKSMVDDNRAALHDTLVSIRQAASGTSELIDGRVGQLLGNAGDLVSELRKVLVANEGPLRAAVFDLRQASRSFKELARDVRQKPSRLLFSKTPPERELP